MVCCSPLPAAAFAACCGNVKVVRSAVGSGGAYSWSVTFLNVLGNTNVPAVTVDTSKVRGNGNGIIVCQGGDALPECTSHNAAQGGLPGACGATFDEIYVFGAALAKEHVYNIFVIS